MKSTNERAKPRGVPRGAEVRAAVIADLATGMTPGEAAEKHGISRHTAWRWWREYVPAVARSETVARLVESYLGAILDALAEQAAQFADPRWLREQSAADLAALHLALGQRAVELLSALQSGERERQQSAQALLPAPADAATGEVSGA